MARRILVIGLSNVGDGILMSPVVARLRGAYPEAHLTLVVGERARAVFARDPRIQDLRSMEEYEGGLGKLRLLALINRLKPDALVDLRNTAWPAAWKPWRMWRYLRKPPAAIAHMRERHLWKLRAQVPGLPAVVASPAASPSSTVFPALPASVSPTASRSRAASPLPAASLPPAASMPSSGGAGDPSLWISGEDDAHVDRLFARWKLPAGRPIALVCPGARSHIKRWAAERFAQVADRLIDACGVEVVLTGEPEEIPIVHEVVKAMRHPVHSAAGCTTLTQLAALMRRASLVLANDSATLHAACAVGTPVVALFGPTDERKYGPTGPRDRVIRRRLFCAPCQQPQCRFSHECMRFIDPDDVFEAARELLTASEA